MRKLKSYVEKSMEAAYCRVSHLHFIDDTCLDLCTYLPFHLVVFDDFIC